MSNNGVNTIFKDRRGYIWFGTNGGGLIYFDRGRNTFVPYKHETNNSNSLSNDVVVTLAIDHEKKLWIGTYQGGLDCYDGRRFIHYRHKDSDPASLSDDRVFALHEDAGGDLWVGTMLGGLDRLDKTKGKFYHNNVSVSNSIHANYVPVLVEDSAANLWIGTSYGIDVLIRNTGKYVYYTSENSKLSDNIINGMYCDHRGNMWVSTKRGLSVMQPGRDTFQVFQTKDGLTSNTVLSILEDRDHFLWVGTSGGLSRIAVSTEKGQIKIKCVNFDEYDGLQGREFNQYAAFRTREGEAPLPASVSRVGKLVLSYDENNFTLEFAALNYIRPVRTGMPISWRELTRIGCRRMAVTGGRLTRTSIRANTFSGLGLPIAMAFGITTGSR